jgi:DNA-binding CsgD family transcriptional regulator
MGSHLTLCDSAWLDLVADVVGRPTTAWPAERVVAQLAETFEVPAGSYYAADGSGTVEQRLWPAHLPGTDRAEIERWTIEQAPREHPLLRFYLATGDPRAMQVADVPSVFAGRRLRARWKTACDERLAGLSSQLALPVCLGPAAHRAFLIGRVDSFTEQEMAAARRLQRVLVGLDRHIAAYAHWAARTGPSATSAATAIGLTPRESAVLGLLAGGHTARVMARRLGVGERTVQKHLQRIYRKLGVADRLGAVRRAELVGVLPAPGP